MKSIYLLLAFGVETRALIVNGTAERCVNILCGYKAECNPTTKSCACTGYQLKSTFDVPRVYYCLELCVTNDDCPNGTMCKEDRTRNKNCYCDVDAGYERSPLGKCINKLPKSTDVSTTVSDATKNEEMAITDTSKGVVVKNSEIVTKDTSTSEDKPSTELVVSVVFNGILVAILIILVIILLRHRVSPKTASNLNTRHVLGNTSREDNRDRDLTDIDVTSPAYQNSISTANVMQSSNVNNTEVLQVSNYVNDDMHRPANPDYVNSPQPSQEYVGLRFGRFPEQPVYEQLQNN